MIKIIGWKYGMIKFDCANAITIGKLNMNMANLLKPIMNINHNVNMKNNMPKIK